MALENTTDSQQFPKLVSEIHFTPLRELENFVNDHPSLGKVASETKYVAVELLRRAAYVDARRYGFCHNAAVKLANRSVEATRRSLGYSYPNDDIPF